MLLFDELEALVEPEGAGFARDALGRPVGVEHAESGAAGALRGARGSESAAPPSTRLQIAYSFFSS